MGGDVYFGQNLGDVHLSRTHTSPTVWEIEIQRLTFLNMWKNKDYLRFHSEYPLYSGGLCPHKINSDKEVDGTINIWN